MEHNENDEDITDLFDFKDNDSAASSEVRLNTKKTLMNCLPFLNSLFEQLSQFLEEKEETFTENLKEHGTNLLKEISERINAINRINKVLSTDEEEVFMSDIELCDEFIEDLEGFSVKIKKFLTENN